MKLALVVVFAACGRGEPAASSASSGPAWSPPAGGPLGSSTELVTAVIDDWSSTKATLRLWSREPTGWRPIGDAWPAVIGHTGAAWGDGLHGTGAPHGLAGPTKREGDGKSPAGVFALSEAFGYAAAPAHASFPYTAYGERSWQCVDDPSSRHYDEIVDRDVVPVDWKSAEDMRATGELYRWVVVVAHNSTHVAGAGSCIFLHVWHGADSSTVGCTAMAEPQLARLVWWLDARASPRLVLLPREAYDALAAPWGLPMR